MDKMAVIAEAVGNIVAEEFSRYELDESPEEIKAIVVKHINEQSCGELVNNLSMRDVYVYAIDFVDQWHKNITRSEQCETHLCH